MKNVYRVISLSLAIVFVLALVPNVSVFADNTYAGSVYQCRLDEESGTLTIRGTIAHRVATQYKDATLALYRLRPWENTASALNGAIPIAESAMSMQFEFKTACTTIADRLSMYVVAVVSADTKIPASAPRFIDCESGVLPSGGFKGINTDDNVSAVNYDATSAFVDVEFDKLENPKRNGYFYTQEGEIFYFDRAYIDTLDKTVRSYTAAGADVYLRLLLPAVCDEPVEFAHQASGGALYRSIHINDDKALLSLYAHIYFICSRYSGDNGGKIAGLVIGRGVNEPLKYNYSSEIGEGYRNMISATIAVIGAAANDAAKDKPVALVLPVTDKMAGTKEPDFQNFVLHIGDYLSERTTLRIFVMAETTHNPYGIYDEFFESGDTSTEDTSAVPPEETSTPETSLSPEETSAPVTSLSPEETFAPETSLSPEETSAPETSLSPEETSAPEISLSPEETSAPETTLSPEETSAPVTSLSPEETSAPETSLSPEETSAPETTLSPETTSPPETPDEPTRPQPTPAGAKYFCADRVDVFTNALERITAKCDAIGREYIWCWYPNANSLGEALSVCYSYGYVSLAAAGASAFVISFEDVGGYGLSEISRLFKYIDTDLSSVETAHALSVFGADDWSDIIYGAKNTTGVDRELVEVSMTRGSINCKGSVNIWDFSTQSGTSGWHGGFNCQSLKSATGSSGKYLKVSFLKGNSSEYSDIGYIGENSNLALFCDSISFDVALLGTEEEKFEIVIKLYADELTVEGKATVSGGQRTLLTIDTSDILGNTTVNSMRLCARRATGDEEFELHLYKISLNSLKYSSDELSAVLDEARDDLLDDKGDAAFVGRAVTAVIVIAVASLLTVGFAVTTDRKRKNNTSKNKEV